MSKKDQKENKLIKKSSKKSQINSAKEIFFYKKNKRDYEPVVDLVLNNRAKEKLAEIKENSVKYGVPNKFLSQWNDISLFNSKGDIDRARALFIESEQSVYELSNPLNDLTSKEWLSETVTVFTQKGLGAGSKDAEIEKLHPAPFSFQDVARLMRFFTKEGDVVLDPFAGVSSTLKACAIENRTGIGFELSEKYVELSKQRIQIEVSDEMPFKDKQKIVSGDCRKLISKAKPDSIDFIITSPPYWDILETVDHKIKQNRLPNNLDVKYSDKVNDFGNIKDYDEFITELSNFFDKCSKPLKSKKYMVVIVSDFRKKEKYYLFHSDLAKAIENKGNFNLKGIKILHQKFKSIYPYGYPYSFVPNVHHQNVLIFQKN